MFSYKENYLSNRWNLFNINLINDPIYTYISLSKKNYFIQKITIKCFIVCYKIEREREREPRVYLSEF